MMDVAERYGPLITDLSAHGTGLSKLDMMGVTWAAPTNQAILRGDEAEVVLIPDAFTKRRQWLCRSGGLGLRNSRFTRLFDSRFLVRRRPPTVKPQSKWIAKRRQGPLHGVCLRVIQCFLMGLTGG